MELLDALSAEELHLIAHLIPESLCKEFFQQHPLELSAVRPDLRIETLTDSEAYSVFCEYIDRSAFYAYANKYVGGIIQTVELNCSNLISSGKTDNQALVESLAASPFSSFPDLFVKITKRSLNIYDLLITSVSLVSPSDVTKLMAQDSSLSVTGSKASDLLVNRLNDHILNLNSIITNFRASVDQLKEQNQLLTSKSVQEEFSEITSGVKYESNDYTSFNVLSAFPYFSIVVLRNINNSRSVSLNRILDISKEGILQFGTFPKWPTNKVLYSNINGNVNQFTQDVPFVLGWKMQANYGTDKKDHIKSTCYFNMPLTQICYVPNCQSTDDLIKSLRSGVSFTPKLSRVLFSCPSGSSDYVGILCTTSCLDIVDNTVKVSKNIQALRVYAFNQTDAINVCGIVVHRRIFLGPHVSICYLINPFQVIKDQLIQRCSIENLSRLNVGQDDIPRLIEVLKCLPTDDLYNQIANLCSCSAEDARRLTDQFIMKSSQFLDQEDIESSVLERAVENSNSLQERCSRLYEDRWRKAAETEIQNTEARAERIRQSTESDIARLKSLQMEENSVLDNLRLEHENLLRDLDSINRQIEERKQFAEDVERNVSKKIESARTHASEFIAEMLFTSGAVIPSPQVNTLESPPGSAEVSASGTPHSTSSIQAGSVLIPGVVPDSDDKETILDTGTLIDVLQYNLQLAGISESCAGKLAVFLYSAYLQKIPLLLAGPNASNISDAFSLSLFGQTADTLCCQGAYSGEVISSLQNPVITVVNPFHPEWVNLLPQILSAKNHFFIAVQPFAEDLLIEPRGLNNYFHPLLTELIVDSPPLADPPVLGQFGSDFKPPEIVVKTTYRNQSIEILGLSQLAASKLKLLFSQFQSLEELDQISEHLFGLFPSAYISGRGSALLSSIRDNASEANILKNIIPHFAHMLGEFE